MTIKDVREIIREVEERKEIAKIVNDDMKKLVRKTMEELLINFHDKILSEYKKRKLRADTGEICSLKHQLVIKFLHEFLKFYTQMVTVLNREVEESVENFKKQLKEK